MKIQKMKPPIRKSPATIALCALCALCAAMLAAGCTQDESLAAAAAGGVAPGQVPLAIMSADVQTEVTVTRASTALGAGSSIGVFLNNASGVTSYTAKNNVRYNCAGAAWNPESEPARIYLTSDNADVCAYYPYRADVTDATRVSLVPRVLADGEAPLAYAANLTVNADNKNVTFSMTQACSWLVIDFTRGDVPDDITLSEFSLINGGLYKAAQLDVTTGGTSSFTAADGGTLTFTGDIALAKNSTVTRSLSMVPSPSLVGGLKVSVKVKEYGGKVLSTTLGGITALARGTKYKITLTVDGTKLEATSVEVLPWTASTVNNGGNPWIPLP